MAQAPEPMHNFQECHVGQRGHPLLAALAALLIQTAFARLGKRDSEPTRQPCPLHRDSDRSSHDD